MEAIVKPKLAMPNIQDFECRRLPKSSKGNYFVFVFDTEWRRCAKQYQSVMKTIVVRHFPNENTLHCESTKVSN